MLTNNNSKLGRGIWAFGLSTSTCTHATSMCNKFCYAKKGHFVFAPVKNMYNQNYTNSLQNDFVTNIVREIRQNYIRYIRIHPSGDFYSQAYFDKWNTIAYMCPQTRFLAYTHNYDLDATTISPNFALYYSVDPSTTNYNSTISKQALVEKIDSPHHMQRYGKYFICQSKCKECKACWSGKINICFPLR